MGWMGDFATTGLAPSLVLSGATWTASRLKDRIPERRRWQLQCPERLTICVAKKLPGTDSLPYTGMGQTTALTVLAPSLAKAYPHAGLPWLHFPDQVRDEAEHDVVLLGGPRTNALSGEALAVIAQRTGIDFGLDALVVSGHEPFPHAHAGPLDSDYGVVARIENPWSASRRTLLVFAGLHTYGVIAAARFFVEEVRPFQWPYRGPFAAVVHSQVRNGYVLRPELVTARPAAPGVLAADQDAGHVR